MATYTNRTCAECGIRKPQPQMYRSETYVENAKSQIGISGATMFGLFAGDKRSGNQFRNWLFNNGQRTYKRKKIVWLCGSCSGVERKPKVPMSKTKKRVYIGIFVILSILTLLDRDEDNKTNPPPTPTTQTSP
jgi:hypothetical protein